MRVGSSKTDRHQNTREERDFQIMADIKFVGESSCFMFTVDGKIHEVMMNAAGYLVMMEPDIVVGKYEAWEEFQVIHPEFATIMVQVIQRKMNETIHMINELQFQNEMPDVLPRPGALPREDDVMYHRAYQ
jgi:hypothetical protein